MFSFFLQKVINDIILVIIHNEIVQKVLIQYFYYEKVIVHNFFEEKQIILSFLCAKK